MSKIYLITRVNWEYNDEWNYIPEGGKEGSPHKAFRDKEKAEAFAKKGNIAALRDLGEDLFTRYVEDIKSYAAEGVDFDSFVREIGGKVNDESRWSSERYTYPKSMTEEKYEKLLEALTIRWWKVIPMEAE